MCVCVCVLEVVDVVLHLLTRVTYPLTHHTLNTHTHTTKHTHTHHTLNTHTHCNLHTHTPQPPHTHNANLNFGYPTHITFWHAAYDLKFGTLHLGIWDPCIQFIHQTSFGLSALFRRYEEEAEVWWGGGGGCCHDCCKE